MRIVVLGAGAIGGYYGGQLLLAGHDVIFVVSPATHAAIAAHGLTLRSPDGTTVIQDVPMVESLAEVDAADVVVSATKIVDGAQLPDTLPAGAQFITTENSVEYPRLAEQKFGADRVIPAVARVFIHRNSRHEVEYQGGILQLSFYGRRDNQRETAAAFAAALEDAGITAVLEPRIDEDLWEKAMFVTCFGVLGAVMDKPLGVVRTEYRSNLAALMAEAAQVARANGVDLSADVVDRVLAFADKQSEAATSSMQRDLAAGVASELDSQVGGIVRLGQQAGIGAPLHELCWNILRSRL